MGKEKNEFIDQLKKRFFQWVLAVSNLYETLPTNTSAITFGRHLIRSSASTWANQRAATRARSNKEFFAKISIAVEEADESLYWLELIQAKNYKIDHKEIERLISEADEITRILATARHKSGQSLK